MKLARSVFRCHFVRPEACSALDLLYETLRKVLDGMMLLMIALGGWLIDALATMGATFGDCRNIRLIQLYLLSTIHYTVTINAPHHPTRQARDP